MINIRQQMGKVKLRVRENALRRREFTVDQMAKSTGLNQESVQSEVRRMKDKGFLIVVGKAPPEDRGAPSNVYRLTDDPEKRLQLASEIEEFYPKAEKEDYPTSPHYFKAQELLDHVEGGRAEGNSRTSILKNAKEELEFAWHEEGEPEGSVDAFIKCQLGRLEYLQGHYEEAQAVLLEAQKIFNEVGMSQQRHCAQEYLSALAVRSELEEKMRPIAGRSMETLVRRTEAAMGTLQKLDRVSLIHNPLSAVLVDLIKDLLLALRSSVRTAGLSKSAAAFWMRPAGLSMRPQVMAAARAQLVDRAPVSSLGFEAELDAWDVRPEPMEWTHNLREEYQYALGLRIGPEEGLQYVALNSDLGKGHLGLSYETHVHVKHQDVGL